MSLEVIDKGPGSAEHPVPLLFVHGGWHAAWCWDEHFLDFFAAKGHRALAVSLRGHGGSPAPTRGKRFSIANFVDDVAQVAATLPTPPVVIGHSLGGFVVQKYLETHEAPAGVLVASLPPGGVGGFLRRLVKRHPTLAIRGAITGRSLHFHGTPVLAREHFFSVHTPESDVIRHAARLDEELTGRLTLDTTLLALPKPDRVTAPVLVLGAENDGCLVIDEIHATARAYRTEAEILPKMGHDMMLEPGWEAVADRIHTWLATRDL